MSDIEMKDSENTEELLKENDNMEELLKENENMEELLKENENMEELLKENENMEELLKENENTEELLKENENTEELLKGNEKTQELLKENENMEELLKENENREELLKENEKTEEQLANEEQPPENSIVDSQINHQQEGKPLSPIQDDQMPGEIIFTEDTSIENKIPEQNGEEDQKLSNDEKQEQPMKEELVHVPEGFDNDQDDSEKTEVAEYDNEGVDNVQGNEKDPVTPTSLIRCSNAKGDDEMKGTPNNWLESEIIDDDEDGSLEEQAAFMNELECFYKERGLKFNPPKFYQQPLNWLKLWRAVIKLGGYDLVTTTKLWRQVGVSFNPPKTCTTVSWTFRIFYEKLLLEYEKYKVQSGELQFSAVAIPESSSVDNDANGHQGPGLPARARRDSTSRATLGWQGQKSFGNGEVGGDPTIMDKDYNNTPKREKSLKSIGSVKHKRAAEIDHTMKLSRTETGKQMTITVEDVGPPADWVKINVREAQDCFEVYALVPGLLREEVRVQSDPAGRLVITGQPEQPDNPWGITPFRKVVTLPARIDPLQTSAVVSLHGRLYVRVPFEESDM